MLIPLALLAAALQSPELEVHPDDPLHRFAELEVGEETVSLEVVSEVSGSLSIWASSEAADPRLAVEVRGLEGLLEDDDSGGGTTAWLDVEVEPGDALVLAVLADSTPAPVELHVVAARESEATRAVAETAAAELAEIDRLRGEGALAEARARVGNLVERLVATGGSVESRRVSQALRRAGFTAYYLSDLDTADRAWAAAHAARERLLPADHPDLLTAKSNLAATRYQLGDLEGALALKEAVHAARERLLPADHPDLLTIKVNLAVTRKALGDLEGALALEDVVHAARERLLPADHPDLLTIKGNLAVTRRELGDLEGARALEEAVHAAWERLLPADHPDLLIAKLNLAGTRYKLGDLEGAQALFEEVHAAWERLLPPDHPDLLRAKGNLAATRRKLGDLEGALTLEGAVHAAWERLLPADHPDLLTVKGNLALTRKNLGDLEGALALEEAVHAARERLLPADHPDLLRAKGNLARTRRKLGDPEGARALARQVAAALASVAAEAVTAAPREARTTGRDAVQRLSEVRFWSESPEAELASPSFEVLETVRYAVSSPLLSRIAGLEGGSVDLVQGRLTAAEREIEELVSRGPDIAEDESSERRDEDHRRWREAIQAAALRRDRAQRELFGLVEEGFVARVTAAEVAGALGPTEIAAGLTKLDRWHWDEAKNQAFNRGPHYLAQILLSDGELREVDLGPASALEEHIDAWRTALGAPVERGAGVVSKGAPSEAEAGRALRRALVDPILAAAGNPEAGATLHLCLDDALFTVPVDALPLDEAVPGEGERLGDRYRVRYEISFARLLRPATELDGPVSVLAVGEVDFDAELEGELLADAAPLSRRSTWGQWERLSATAAEASELAYQAEKHLDVEARVLRRDEVTENALAEAVKGARYVHLATHGFFIPRTERKSMLDEEPGGGVDALGASLLGNRATVTGFAPETLCGLVLSGANSGETDAERSACLLTAQELGGFDLRACDLAVLSACETNVGIARAGQGIQSLQSALHRAGARTSITSLWAVQDWPTQSLMKRFYENLWGKGMSKADALWEAKRALREEGHPPYVWAGWVLAGDPD